MRERGWRVKVQGFAIFVFLILSYFQANANGNHRVMAVVIDNVAMSRPQTGLSKADIVYEFRVEGGITRYLAFYYDEPPAVIGPVRSARHYFLPYIQEHHAFLIHYGGSPRAWNDLVVMGINHLDGIDPNTQSIFFRSTSRKAPYNAYVSTEKARKMAEMNGWGFGNHENSRVLFFSPGAEIRGEKNVHHLEISFHISTKVLNSVSWDYDDSRGVYLRSINDEPQNDASDGSRIVARNILIQLTSIWNIDEAPTWRIDMKVEGSGKGYILSGGKMAEIRWQKSSLRDKTIYYYPSGAALMLPTGVTWIEMVPETAPIKMAPLTSALEESSLP